MVFSLPSQLPSLLAVARNQFHHSSAPDVVVRATLPDAVKAKRSHCMECSTNKRLTHLIFLPNNYVFFIALASHDQVMATTKKVAKVGNRQLHDT